MDYLNILYKELYSSIKKELWKYGCPRFIFDDIYHDAFIILLKKQKNSLNREMINSGLVTTICKCLWFKRKNNTKIHENIDEMDIADEQVTNIRELNRFLLRKHLKNLSLTCREILKFYTHGYSEAKINRVMRLGGRDAVKNKKFYCKESLKKMIMNDPSYKEIHG